MSFTLPLPPPARTICILRLVDRSFSPSITCHVARTQVILVVHISVLNKYFILSFSTFQKSWVYFIWNSILFHDSYEFFLNRWDKSMNHQVHQGKLIGCSFRLRRCPVTYIELSHMAQWLREEPTTQADWVGLWVELCSRCGNLDKLLLHSAFFSEKKWGKNNTVIRLRCGLNKKP